MIYKYVPLAELGEIVAGSTPDTFVKEYWGGDIPWITPADLTDHQGIFFNGKLRKITDAGYRSCSTRMLPPGSILYSCRAPIGHCAVTAYPLCTNQGFKSIIPNERLDAVYGYFALKHLTPKIENLGRGATFTEVNKEIFGTILYPSLLFPNSGGLRRYWGKRTGCGGCGAWQGRWGRRICRRCLWRCLGMLL